MVNCFILSFGIGQKLDRVLFNQILYMQNYSCKSRAKYDTCMKVDSDSKYDQRNHTDIKKPESKMIVFRFYIWLVDLELSGY